MEPFHTHAGTKTADLTVGKLVEMAFPDLHTPHRSKTGQLANGMHVETQSPNLEGDPISTEKTTSHVRVCVAFSRLHVLITTLIPMPYLNGIIKLCVFVSLPSSFLSLI